MKERERKRKMESFAFDISHHLSKLQKYMCLDFSRGKVFFSWGFSLSTFAIAFLFIQFNLCLLMKLLVHNKMLWCFKLFYFLLCSQFCDSFHVVRSVSFTKKNPTDAKLSATSLLINVPRLNEIRMWWKFKWKFRHINVATCITALFMF